MRDRRTDAVLNRPKRTRRQIAGCAALLAAAVAVGAVGCGPTHTTSQDAVKPVAETAAGGAAGASSPSATPSEPETPDPVLPSPSATAAVSSPTAQAKAVPTPGAHGTSPSAGSPQGAVPGSPTASSPTGPSIPVIGHTASGGRSVALTFDDGPGTATGEVLDVLAQYNVKATFCEIGKQAAANPAMVKRIVAAGHRLCDHTVDHPQPMHTLPHEKQTSEIDSGKDMIIKAAGAGTRIGWYRAPGGDFSADSKQIAAHDGMTSLGWSVDTVDWSRPGVPAILAAVQKELKPGGVILMHDGGGDRSQTVEALKQLIPSLVSQGYTFDLPAA